MQRMTVEVEIDTDATSQQVIDAICAALRPLTPTDDEGFRLAWSGNGGWPPLRAVKP